MKLNIIYLGIFVAWIFSFVHAEQKFTDPLKAASYKKTKVRLWYAYHQNYIPNETTTIIDSDGNITICTVTENKVIVCL